MLKRIMAIAKRDFKSGMRDLMFIYILAAPLLIALVLRLFVPATSSISVTFAVPDDTDAGFVQFLEGYGRVHKAGTVQDVEDRVKNNDDIIGITRDGQGYRILTEGNESEGITDAAKAIMFSYENPEIQLPVEIRFSDTGWKISPFALFGAASMLVFLPFITGILITFNVVEDKQFNTLRAVYVTPVTKTEYVLGKSLPGLVMPLLQALVVLAILDVFYVNKAMVLVMVFVSSLIGIILGFLIGSMNNNTMAAISSMKTASLPLLAGLLGGMLLNEKWQPVVYWSPFYWAYTASDKIIRMTAAWNDVLISSAAILVITMAVFILLRKKIMKSM